MKKCFVVLSLLALLFVAASANAQSTQTVTLTANITETLTLACTPSAITFASGQNLLNGNPMVLGGNVPLSCTTTYNLAATRHQLAMDVYTNAGATALTSGANSIANTQVSTSFDSGAWNPCTNSDGLSSFGCDTGSGYVVASTTTAGWPNGTSTDSVAFVITLAPGQAPGSYSGTVTLALVAS